MIGYSTLYKSMNGIKVLSDGVSVISDGQAQHENIIYNDYIYSEDAKTQLTNNKVKTEEIECNDFQADNIMSLTINTNSIQTKYFLVNNNNTDYFKIDAVTNNKLTSNIEMDLYEPLNIINKDFHQTQTGRIYQQGTNNNYLKDTYINGYLEIGSNLTQSGGSTSLKDLTIDNLTMRANKSITQTGSNVSNTLAGTTTTKDLIILDSVVFPASVTVPGTTTTDDIVMEGNSVIVQDLTTTTTKKNIFRNTKTLDLEIDGNLSQIKAGATATLKNTTIQGTAEIQGDIAQTAGTTVLKTLRCNNITLNDDQLITMSGTGYITQSGTGTNTMKAITLLSNANLTFQGSGIISQALSGINILSHFRSAGWGIIGGRNNTTYTNYQNIQNNNGLQIQFNRDNSTQYSFLMNNRSSGGNGGFRFQRYTAGVYVDEPLVIDDNITMNKNLSIPGGSLTCSSATIGNISQTELNCLDNCNTNINDKFIALDSQIANLQTSSAGNTTALTGISYTSATDTTLIDNNLTISTGKNLLVGTTNIITAINNINSTLSGISYDSVNDLTTVNNHMILPSGNNFFLGSGYNVKTNIDDCITRLSGITYSSASDTTNIDNNVQITAGKKLYIGTMDIEAEINALDTSFTTGTINSTDLTTTNLYVNGAVRLNQNSGTTFIYSDLRLINVSTKNANQFAQLYCGGLNWDNVLYRPNGNYTLFIRNTADTANIQYLNVNSTSFNIKNTNALIDNNLTVNGTTALNGGLGIIGGDLNVYSNSLFNSTVSMNSTSDFYNIATFHSNILASSNIQLKQRLNIGSAKNINSNLSLTFPLDEYNIINQSVNITITLPTISNSSFNGVVTTFILNVKTANATLTTPSGTNFYDINNNLISNIVLSGSTYLNVKVYASNNHWYIFDYITNPNTISTTTLNSTTSNSTTINNSGTTTTNTLNSTTINNSGGITTNNTTVSNNATINNNLFVNGHIKSKSIIPGYMFDGANSFLCYPIPGSMKGFRPADVDDYYYVNPGFRFDVYENDNYGGSAFSLVNDSNAPNVFQATNINKVGSIKVFFRPTSSDSWTEITMNFLS